MSNDENQAEEQQTDEETQEQTQPVNENVPRETNETTVEPTEEIATPKILGKFNTHEELEKGYSELEKFVGGKKEEFREEIINELSEEAMSEKPEEYTLPALPETITEEMVLSNPMMEWWQNHCDENAYDNDMFQEGINKYVDMIQNSQPDEEKELEALGENVDARLDAVYNFLDTNLSPEQADLIDNSTLTRTAQGIEVLESIIELTKNNISGKQPSARPVNQLTLNEVRSMMKDPRYYDSRHRDDSYVKKVDDAFNRLYR